MELRQAQEQLQKFGMPVGSDCIVDLHNDKKEARTLRYVDMLQNKPRPAVDCVVEQQSRALLYIIDDRRIRGEEIDIPHLRRTLGMRGEAAWLGVLKPGELAIHTTDLHPDASVETHLFSMDNPNAMSVMPLLMYGDKGGFSRPDTLYLRDQLLKHMINSTQELIDCDLDEDNAIALVGRALFLRYLMGRQIVKPEHLKEMAPNADSWEKCLNDRAALTSTNNWLDKKFNGDLLVVNTEGKKYHDYFEGFSTERMDGITASLSAIMRFDSSIEPGVSQGHLGWKELDFSHLPIGLISESYEGLMRNFQPEEQKKTSAYYTPWRIAEYMVEEALYKLPERSTARVLDPACGAGVFLAAAFRKLIEMHFHENKEPPSREVIRNILYNQLTGFEINPHARALAAFSLYLTALELDRKPEPLDELKFKKIDGSVLIDVRERGDGDGYAATMMGSLNDKVLKKYARKFDAVIGNPPWTSSSKQHNSRYTNLCRNIAAKRNLEEIAKKYKNPDNNPDLPFLWASMQWAKPGGRITLALSARLLFKQSRIGINARRDIFKALKVRGILNGASFKSGNNGVWPKVGHPFCLLFADNEVPSSEDQFVFLSPYIEPNLNDNGLMRIDATAAAHVSLDSISGEEINTYLLKTLYIGASLDLRIMRKIGSMATQTIKEYWDSNELASNQGFLSGTKGTTGNDEFLEDYKELPKEYAEHPFLVFPERLSQYRKKPNGLEKPRRNEKGIYKGPLLLVRDKFNVFRAGGRVLICDSDLAYSRYYYGYSAANIKYDGDYLVRYLQILAYSKVMEYHILMSSGRVGVEPRGTILKMDFDNFPIVPPETLSHKQRNAIEAVSRTLAKDSPDWSKLDNVVFDIYQLSKTERERIADMLSIESSTDKSSSVRVGRGDQPVTPDEAQAFVSRLREELASVFDVGGHTTHVKLLEDEEESYPAPLPWLFFSVALDDAEPLPKLPDTWMKQANIDNLGVSRIIMVNENTPSVTIGLLRRYRHWLPSNAHILASLIVWEHGALLENGRSS